MGSPAWRQWVKTDADQRAVDEGCWFDEQAGQYVVEFFQRFLNKRVHFFRGAAENFASLLHGEALQRG